MEDRRLELGLTWTGVAQVGGTTSETLRQARRGDGRIADLTFEAIDKGLRWQRGSARAVLAGGEPVPLPAGPVPLSAVPVEPNAVEAIEGDPDLDRDTKEHLVRQYWLLREVAAMRRGEPPPAPDPISGHRRAGAQTVASVTPSAPSRPND